MCASPTAAKVAADARACGKTVEAGATAGGATAGTATNVAARLEPWMIQQALAPAVAAAQQCLDTYGVTGTATLRLQIKGDGSLAAVELRGEFANTPTGACVTRAVRAVTFPPSRKARTVITYPIVLR